MKPTLSSVRIFVLAASLTLLHGCQDHDPLLGSSAGLVSNDGTETVDSRFDPGTLDTAQFEKLLARLESSLEKRSLRQFDRLFDTEQFRFVFDPADVEENPGLPPFWTWTEERSAAQSMFDSDLVRSVSVDYEVGTPRPVEEFDNAPLHWYTARVMDIQVEVVMIDPSGGDDIVFHVSGDHAQFFFEAPSRSTFGRRTTKITEWRDIRIGKRSDSSGAQRNITSWGLLKALFVGQ